MANMYDIDEPAQNVRSHLLQVPMVLDTIPEDERCSCEPKVEKEGK